MAPKPSAYCFLALFLVLSSSAAVGRSERLRPEVAAGCWKEIYQIPSCLFSILRAFFSDGGSIETSVGVPCCAAFLSLTGDCQVEIFQNSSIIPLIEVFCGAVVGSGGDAPPSPPEIGGETPLPEPEPPVAPAPESGGDLPLPEPGAPVMAPAYEDLGSTFPWPTVRLV